MGLPTINVEDGGRVCSGCGGYSGNSPPPYTQVIAVRAVVVLGQGVAGP